MGSSNRGVTNVKLTLRVNHPATDKMKLSFAFMTGPASTQYAQPMYQQQPAMGGMGNNLLLPLLLMDGGLGGSGSSNDLLLPLMLSNHHTKPYQTIPNHTKPYQTIPNHTKPYQTIPNQTIPNHTKPYQTIPNHTKPYQTPILSQNIFI